MTVQEILQTITYRDDASQGNESIGNFQEIFSQFDALPVKVSKSGARRCTIMLRNKQTGKLTNQNVVMSPTVTDLFRGNKVTMEHIAGFPVFHGDKGFFVGLPSQGWIEVKTIKVAQWVPEAISPEDLVG